MPVVALWMDIEVAKSCRDKGVHYGEGVGDDVKNCYVDQQIGLGRWNRLLTEIVSVSRRWSQHDNHRDDPVLEQPSQRGIEWLVTSPEATER